MPPDKKHVTQCHRSPNPNSNPNSMSGWHFVQWHFVQIPIIEIH